MNSAIMSALGIKVDTSEPVVLGDKLCFTRRSILSGKVNQMIVEATLEQWEKYRNGAMIQHAFSNLTADEREFIMTGITSNEWKDE